MALALVLINLVSYLALVATVFMVSVASRWLGLDPMWHQRVGLGAALGLLLGHSMTLFYFIGTGKRVKELVAEHGLDGELVTRATLFKQAVFPWALWGMLAVMAAFSVGSGVQVERIPAFIHWGLAIVAVLINLVALLREVLALVANGLLLNEVALAVHGEQPPIVQP